MSEKRKTLHFPLFTFLISLFSITVLGSCIVPVDIGHLTYIFSKGLSLEITFVMPDWIDPVKDKSRGLDPNMPIPISLSSLARDGGPDYVLLVVENHTLYKDFEWYNGDVSLKSDPVLKYVCPVIAGVSPFDEPGLFQLTVLGFRPDEVPYSAYTFIQVED
jgi:hypothetical protein